MARFAAFYSETSDLRYGDIGWSTDGQSFGSPRRAIELAERWLAEGRYCVTVQDLEERLFKSWPICGTSTQTYTSADGHVERTHHCVRQDLHSDGRCAEHTEGGTAPPTRSLQLELTSLTSQEGSRLTCPQTRPSAARIWPASPRPPST